MVALVAWAGCSKRSGPLPLCLAETVEAGDDHELSAEVWFATLLPDYSRDTRRVARPSRDCTGTATTWPTDGACPLAGDAAPLPERPLGAQDILLAPIDPQRTLVWLITRRFADGDGLGPAALIEWLPRGLAVRAAGPLRAPTQGAQLRLEPLAETSVLVVDAERCRADVCRPVTVLVPLLAGRFQPGPLLGDHGRCDGPPEIDRARLHQQSLGQTIRRYTLSAALRFEGGAVVVDEQVRVIDDDPRRPEDAPREFRRVSHQRRIELKNGRLHGDRPGLWPRVLAEDARVDGRDPSSNP